MGHPSCARAYPIAKAERLHGVNSQAPPGEDRERPGETSGAVSESCIAGVIVDSWVENALPAGAGLRLVLQVAPREHPETLVIVEADASLLTDRLWLEDLGENLCHGSPVVALGSRSCDGFFAAAWLHLTR